MVFIGDCNICSAFSRLFILSCINIGSGISCLLYSDDMLYGLYKNTSSSCTMPSFCFPLSMFISCGASLYVSWYAS